MVRLIAEENISLSHQTDIAKTTIEINTPTTNYTGNNYPNSNKIATVMLNPTPSLHGNCLWTPEVSDDVVPGLDSMITYTLPKYATLAALRNATPNIYDNSQTEKN